MSNEDIEKLENELKERLKQSAEISRQQLQYIRADITKRVQDVIQIYSNSLRNLGIISGTVAPFSLTLLGVEKLNTNLPFLLLGFSFLLGNIILTQFLLNKEATKDDVHIVKAQMQVFYAEGNLEKVEDINEISNNRVLSNFDYLENIRSIEKLLGDGSHIDQNLTKLRANLRKYNKFSLFVFTLGTFFIIFSVIFYPLTNLIAQYFFKH